MTQRIILSGRYVGHVDETIEIECDEARFEGASVVNSIAGAAGDTMISLGSATLLLMGLSAKDAKHAFERKWTHVTWGEGSNSRTGAIGGRTHLNSSVLLSVTNVQ